MHDRIEAIFVHCEISEPPIGVFERLQHGIFGRIDSHLISNSLCMKKLKKLDTRSKINYYSYKGTMNELERTLLDADYDIVSGYAYFKKGKTR